MVRQMTSVLSAAQTTSFQKAHLPGTEIQHERFHMFHLLWELLRVSTPLLQSCSFAVMIPLHFWTGLHRFPMLDLACLDLQLLVVWGHQLE
jgi:hypothetical protein